MIDTFFGTKLDVSQRFTQDGKRMPVTRIQAEPGHVVQIKEEKKDGYQAIQIGWGEKELKGTSQAVKGHVKGAKMKKAPLFLSEIRVSKTADFKVGQKISLGDVFQPGDKVQIGGQSKGRGFTGVMKRWGFKGGPRTHGQSDRQRAPGSIGQGTTPGRVFRGKKMPGRSGGTQVTVSGLMIVGMDLEKNLLLVKGLVPGPRRGKLVIKKIGQTKKFVALLEIGGKEIQETEVAKEERLRKEKEMAEKAKEVEEEVIKETKGTKETGGAEDKIQKEEKDAES